MPDTHTGKGMPIGGVIACKNTVIPNAVGVDIGCGMAFVQTDIPVSILRDTVTGSGELIKVIVVKEQERVVENYHNISIVYTKEAETADTYIERTAHKLSREHKVRVATSDGMEQVIIMGSGAFRMSAQELHEDVIRVEKEITSLADTSVHVATVLIKIVAFFAVAIGCTVVYQC